MTFKYLCFVVHSFIFYKENLYYRYYNFNYFVYKSTNSGILMFRYICIFMYVCPKNKVHSIFMFFYICHILNIFGEI